MTDIRKKNELAKAPAVGGAVRTLAVLEHVASMDRPVSGADITRATQTNPSTAFNLLRTLTAGGYLEQVRGTRLYVAGPALRALGRKIAQQTGPHDLALVPMQRVADRHKVVVSLWERVSRFSMSMLVAAENEAAPRIEGRPHAKFPALHGSMGRLVALGGDLSDAERRQLHAGVNFERPVSYRTFMGQAREAADRGWSIDDGNVRSAIASVSVPVATNPAHLAHVCTATMFRGQCKGKALEELVHDLKKLAALIGPNFVPPNASDFGC